MAMFPALSSEIAQLIVRDRAFYSRARTSVTLRISKQWREGARLTCEKVFFAITHAKCLSSDSLREVYCKKCMEGNFPRGSSILLICCDVAQPEEENLQELYSFSVISRCSSSRKHLGASSVCLTIILPCGFRVVSQEIQLRARPTKSKPKLTPNGTVTKTALPATIVPGKPISVQAEALSTWMINEARILPSEPKIVVRAVLISEKLIPSHGIPVFNKIVQLPHLVSGIVVARLLRIGKYPAQYPFWPIMPAGESRIFISMMCYTNVECAARAKKKFDMIMRGDNQLSANLIDTGLVNSVAIFKSW